MPDVLDPATVERLLQMLVPARTGVAACQADASLLHHLAPEERALVDSARTVRQSEFAAGRACAHAALAAIGADVDTIDRGTRGQPIWPSGVTGSISHAGGLAAAVATRATRSVTGLGLDVEHLHRLDCELWPHVLTPAERARCRSESAPLAAATSVFSAKEAAFKALFPLLHVEIDFLEAHTALDGGGGHVRIPRISASVAVRQTEAGAFVLSLALVESAA